MIAVGMFVLGAFAVGWAGVVSLLGRHPETDVLIGLYVRKLLQVGLFGCLGSLLMLSLELALAWVQQP
jgi:hypothetical protein